jgi:hypothetical protein
VHETGRWVHSIRAAAVGRRRLPASLQVAHGVQQSAPQCDNSSVARTQVLLGPIRYRPVQVLLNRYVLLSNTAHPGEVFVSLLSRSTQIVHSGERNNKAVTYFLPLAAIKLPQKSPAISRRGVRRRDSFEQEFLLLFAKKSA